MPHTLFDAIRHYAEANVDDLGVARPCVSRLRMIRATTPASCSMQSIAP